ncbi:MAG: hypothetical protein ACON43_02555 [Flavobacteriaceae bacterium]
MNILSNIRQWSGYGKGINLLTKDRKERIFNSSERLTLDKDSIEPIHTAGDFKFLNHQDIYQMMQEFQKLDAAGVFNGKIINDTNLLRLTDIQETIKEWQAKLQVVRNEIYLLEKDYFDFWESLSEGKTKHEWKILFKKVKSSKLKQITGVRNNTIRAAIEEVLSDRASNNIRSKQPLSNLDKTYAITSKDSAIQTKFPSDND